MVEERETKREVGTGKHKPYGYVSMSGTRHVTGSNREKWLKTLEEEILILVCVFTPVSQRSAVLCQWHSQVSYLDVLWSSEVRYTV